MQIVTSFLVSQEAKTQIKSPLINFLSVANSHHTLSTNCSPSLPPPHPLFKNFTFHQSSQAEQENPAAAMVPEKRKVVIIGAGMAGLTAAQKLHATPSSKNLFELSIVEGGNRIGGRVNTSEFGGDRIEMGATWIHGIIGSPVHKIAEKINSLESQQPWECMDGFSNEKIKVAETIAEGGLVVDPSIIEPISLLFDKLMDIAQCKLVVEDGAMQKNGTTVCGSSLGKQLSVGSFLRQGLKAYWDSKQGTKKEAEGKKTTSGGDWNLKLLEEAAFAMFENVQRTYTGAGDLHNLDYDAESEYRMFPGEEITIPRGYTSVIEALASSLPSDVIQLGKKVVRIEWLPKGVGGVQWPDDCENNKDGGGKFRPVKLHFNDGSMMLADHVIVTVSLGVLKAGIQQESGQLFSPPLPDFKREAISRLGYGIVNKLFLQLSTTGSDCLQDGSNNQNQNHASKFPYMQMLFHRMESDSRHQKIPWWLRRTASLYPIYSNSSVLLCWFAGKEALELENLDDEEIIDGVSRTVSSFLSSSHYQQKQQANSYSDNDELRCNDNVNSSMKFTKVLRTRWGTDPLFLGSYSYVAVGSSGVDFDTIAEPLPRSAGNCDDGSIIANPNPNTDVPPFQLLFAGEATHRTHYSTTHGAYLSGLREANRLLQHYSSYGGVAQLD